MKCKNCIYVVTCRRKQGISRITTYRCACNPKYISVQHDHFCGQFIEQETLNTYIDYMTGKNK